MKYRFFLNMHYTIAAVLVFLLFCSYAGQQLLHQSLEQPPRRDSALLKLQAYLDSNYKVIDNYYKVVAEKKLRETEKKTDTKRLQQISDSMNIFLKADFCKICAQQPPLSMEERKMELKKLYESITRLEKEARQLNDKWLVKSSLELLDSQAKAQQKIFDGVSGKLAAMSDKLTGAGALNVPLGDKISRYRFFIASKTQYFVQVHNSREGPASIEALLKNLSKTSEPMMITNAGMFQPGYSPQGLLVQNAKIMHALDTNRPDKSNLNFYLLPNGVFYMDPAGNFKIEETGDFQKAYPAQTKKLPMFATQSGPLLFEKDSINSNFRPGSVNTNIRSGVGVLDAGRVVFIISDSPVNFHDFTLVFKEVFKCKSALYLDGAISEMYISDKMLNDKKAVISGNFGPLISITKKKKS